MKQFDRRIKQAISDEAFELPIGYEDKLENILAQLEGASEKQILFYKKRMPRKALVLVATLAVFILCFAGGSTIKTKVIKEDGSIAIWTSELRDDKYTELIANIAASLPDNQFLSATSVYKFDSPCLSYRELPADAEYQTMIRESTLPFKLPEIPDGYKLTGGYYTYFLDRDYKECTFERVEKKKGVLYAIYNYPEGYEKNIGDVWLYFENSAGQQFSFSIQRKDWLCLGYDYDEKLSLKDISVDGYEGGQFMKSDSGMELKLYDHIAPYTYVKTFYGTKEQQAPIKAYAKKHPGLWMKKIMDMRAPMEPEDVDPEDPAISISYGEEADVATYDQLCYTLWSDTFSKEELLKIVQTMK